MPNHFGPQNLTRWTKRRTHTVEGRRATDANRAREIQFNIDRASGHSDFLSRF